MGGSIELQSAGRTFRQGEVEIHALHPTDLLVPKGELLALIGRSGSGKSTLLNLLTGVDRPTSGRVVVDGVDLTALDEGALAQFRGRNIGIVFQFFELIPTLTIQENVVLAMDLVGSIAAADRKARALELLDRLGVADQAKKLPSRLSGGQQQRAAVARALANDPAILVADEPSGNLDSANSELVLDIFRTLSGEGRTVIIATHESGHLEQYDRVLQIADGRIVPNALSVAA